MPVSSKVLASKPEVDTLLTVIKKSVVPETVAITVGVELHAVANVTDNAPAVVVPLP